MTAGNTLSCHNMLGVQPRYMGVGPVFAIPKVLQQVGLEKEDVDVWEVCFPSKSLV